MLALDDTNFDQCIKTNKAVLVDCYATWCGPCKAFAPILEQFAASQNKVKVYKMDVERAPKSSSKYGVTAMPTALYFVNGVLKSARVGGTDLATLKRLYPGA